MKLLTLKIHFMKKLLTLFILVAGLISYSQTTIYVTNTLDSTSGSLRVAIDSANDIVMQFFKLFDHYCLQL